MHGQRSPRPAVPFTYINRFVSPSTIPIFIRINISTRQLSHHLPLFDSFRLLPITCALFAPNGALLSLFFSCTSALFSIQRGVAVSLPTRSRNYNTQAGLEAKGLQRPFDCAQDKQACQLRQNQGVAH
jgi:hypothetical protein